MPYEALSDALDNPVVQPARRTFGKVEYAFIPVSVIEAVLLDAATEADDVDLDEQDYADEDVNDEVGITAAEVAVVETPTDPLAVFPEDGTVEVAGPSPTGDDEADVAEGYYADAEGVEEAVVAAATDETEEE
jgi:hypothetical protein